MAARLALLAVLLLGATPARAALSPNAELALDRGLHHLYGLDYTEARADFRKLIEQEPDNPFGYLFESGAIWWQSSMEYGLFKDTPTLQGLFEQDVDFAIKKADPLTDSKDKSIRADGHFVSGMALGTRGQWGLMRGHYVKAYFDGKKAMKHLKKVPKLDPDYHDVDLGLGVFDYQAARLSGTLAALSAIGGLRGDEKRGLAEIRSAVEHGKHARVQAAQMLTTIFILDKRDFQSALPVVQELRRDFPESVYFLSLEILARWKLGQREHSLELGRAMFEAQRRDPPAFDRKLLSLVCGLTGEQCLDAAQTAAMAEWFDAAIAAAPKPKTPPSGKGPKARAAQEAAAFERDYLAALKKYRAWLEEAKTARQDVLLRLRDLSR